MSPRAGRRRGDARTADDPRTAGNVLLHVNRHRAAGGTDIGTLAQDAAVLERDFKLDLTTDRGGIDGTGDSLDHSTFNATGDNRAVTLVDQNGADARLGWDDLHPDLLRQTLGEDRLRR
ncbi:hypothetical protein V6L77_12265 [Pannonibacter sp. Pt2-lr]